MLNQLTKQSGVTLLESMIALLVISIGLLGIAGLQINSLKQNSSALWHSQAVLAGQNMADRIRANQVETANYVDIDTNNSYSTNCMANACNSGDMLLADATDWAALLSTLPSGRGKVTSPPGVGAPTQLDITVMWDDEGTGATGDSCSSDHTQDLTCYTITMRIVTP